MGPLTLTVYAKASEGVKRKIAGAMHLSIDDSVRNVLIDVANPIWRDSEIGCFQFEMPAPVVVIEQSDRVLLIEDGGDHVDLYAAAGRERVDFYATTGRYTFRPVMRLFKKDRYYALDRRVEKSDDKNWWFNCGYSGGITADILFSLMAEPRLVRKESPARSMRRQAKRVLGRNVPTEWYVLNWTIGDEVCPKGSSGSEGFRMPLHFCRAHWHWVGRKTKTSELRHGIRGYGHYVWNRHAWKGHPDFGRSDFGVKLKTYAPEIDPDGKSLPVIEAIKRQATAHAREAALKAWRG